MNETSGLTYSMGEKKGKIDEKSSLTGSTEEKTMSMMFKVWLGLAEILGVVALVLAGTWLGTYRGGFAWQWDPAKEFNYHPLFMILSLVFLNANALLVYRVFPNCSKPTTKVLHGTLHVMSFIFMVVGLKAVFDSHNLVDPPLSNMYSLHSWIGMITVLLYCMQWVAGLLIFAFGLTSSRPDFAADYKPVHAFWGLAIFIMAVGVSLSGLTEKELLANSDGYQAKNAEGITVNFLAVVLVGMALTVAYILTNRWPQDPPPPKNDIYLPYRECIINQINN